MKAATRSGPSLLALNGLVPCDDSWTATMSARVDRARAIVPLVLTGHVLALGLAVGLLLDGRAGASILHVAAAAGFSVIAICGQTVALHLSRRRRIAIHHLVRAACVAGIVQGASLALLIGAVAAMAPGPLHDAALVAAMFACGLCAVHLSGFRAALTAFLATLSAGLVLALSSPMALLAAVPLLPVAILLDRRFGELDRTAHRAAARADADRGLASRLVREFEGQGSGWFWETDLEGRLTYLSDAVRRAVERPDRPVLGIPLVEIFRLAGQDVESERTLGFHLSTRTSFADYSVQANGAGGDRWWSISGRPLIDEIGQYRGFTGSGGDLTEKRRAEAEISRMALFDSLTGLANRQRMRLSLDTALAQGQIGGRATAVFLLDLDRFKAVNDTMGHQVGDGLLKLVAERLVRTIGDTGLVGRPGGDEFQVILPNGGDRKRLVDLANGVIAALSAPYVVNGVTMSIGCSMGIAVAPEHGGDSETLIRNADLALYAAKADGRGIHRFYRPQLLAAAQSRRQLEDDLRHAYARGEFHLVYQPVVSTQDEHIVGYEALLRWDHPERGPISPADFVPVAEECGLIEKIGEWVLRTACIDAAAWPGGVRVAVNVSPIQFANPSLPATLVGALGQAGLPAGRLELEITEGVFLTDNGSTDRMFEALKGIGVRLALDDFGTGYSSLGYLKQAPFDKIKIDQSFVRGAATEGSRNAAIIQAIVALADTLGMETTAEGVEFADEIILIRELGCSHIQGYVYGKPVRQEEVLRQLGMMDGQVQASGAQVSRAPRMSMLRIATVQIGSVRGSVRIRNMTANGAMIDGVGLIAPGTDLMIEIFPGETIGAQAQWARDGKAGLRFHRPIELERLLAAADFTQRVA